MSPVRKRNNNKGSGLINSVINHLPVELHLPGYRFAGPGTKLKERLARGERGINRLDELARAHNIAYDESNSLSDRHRADEILENQAWEVFKSKNTDIKEKAASWLVTTAMKAKRKLGAGCGFKQMVSAAKKAIKNKVNENNITKLVRTCLTAAKKSKKLKKSKSIKTPRIIPIPKKGGVLPLIPIFAGLSALGALTGGVGNIVKVVNDLNSGKNTPIHLGKGLYLTPHKGSSYKIVKGKGLNLAPYKGALYDYEIIKYADMLKIPHFIGVFARDKLPRRAKHQESAVLNLDIETGTGSYELKEIETVIKHLLSESEDTFQLKANTNTLKCEMSSNMIIDFSIPHSICVLLGLENRIYDANVRHQSDTLVNITKTNCIYIDSNLVKGSFFNDVTAGYTDDCKITQIDYHSFLPYSTSVLSNNDEVRIALHNTESYTLPCESYIYIEGTITKPVEITDEIRFINNGLAFLFSEMKYEINSTQIQKLVNPGITTTLKGYCSYNKTNIISHHNAAWDSDLKNVNKDFIDSGNFNGCINLKDLFGFCEDYKRILINCNQQLILNRASIDLNAIKQYKNSELVDAPKLKDVKINISKILWRMPIVKVSDKEKIRLLKVINNQKPLTCAFRSWELCEYPFLPQNTSHSWKVKTSNKLEKPRYVKIGFQTDRKNSSSKTMSYFDHCKIKNLKVYLNSEVFPYEDFQSDFTKNKMATLYRAYAEFQKSYYGHDDVTPLLNRSDFKNLSPIAVVDMSRQNDNVKMSTVDLRIELEANEAFPASTSAYCLILHDQIITYNPFNGEVRTL
ncbi:hypothetical protein QTP88_001158 [Uroleucon formosanum]